MLLPGFVPQQEHSLHAIERGWHADFVDFLQRGIPKILVALVIAFVAQRIVKFFYNRLLKRSREMVGNGRRSAQLRTVAGIVRASAYGLIGFYVFLQVLGAIGVPLGPFIASASVIGLGISFGAQSLFKDMLNGMFILVEDQFAVGDVVKLAGLQGTVEDLTLRIAMLRDGDGTLYIIPNSQITTVSNLSRDFSVASLSLVVSAQENPDKVLTVLRSLAQEVHADPAFADIVLTAPDVPGVDKISGREVTYPINVRVRANQRDGVLRELRRRILLRFAKEKIEFGVSSSVLLVEHPDPTAPAAAHPALPMGAA